MSEILLYVSGAANGAFALLGVAFLMLSAVWFATAVRTRRRGVQRRYDQVQEPAPEVVALAEQGRRIQAIKRYRELNPDIGLNQAKDVIDGL